MQLLQNETRQGGEFRDGPVRQFGSDAWRLISGCLMAATVLACAAQNPPNQPLLLLTSHFTIQSTRLFPMHTRRRRCGSSSKNSITSKSQTPSCGGRLPTTAPNCSSWPLA